MEDISAVAGLSLVDAAAVELLVIGTHAGIAADSDTLVIGSGSILDTTLLARIVGQAMTVMDTSGERLDFAKVTRFSVIIGALVPAVDLMRERTDGDCFDLAYDVTDSKIGYRPLSLMWRMAAY